MLCIWTLQTHFTKHHTTLKCAGFTGATVFTGSSRNRGQPGFPVFTGATSSTGWTGRTGFPGFTGATGLRGIMNICWLISYVIRPKFAVFDAEMLNV